MTINRRNFSFSAGAFTLAFLCGDRILDLTPAQAKAQDIAFQTLNKKQASLIDSLGDAIVPGAKKAGLSHYIDHQLSVKKSDTLLILKYLRVNPPFDGFYIASLLAFEKSAKHIFSKQPDELTEEEYEKYITQMMRKNPEGWDDPTISAPPAPFFYFVLRSDAIDVTYGSERAYEELDIPYMAHISPSHQWEV